MIDYVVTGLGYLAVAFTVWMIFEMIKEAIEDIKNKGDKK